MMIIWSLLLQKYFWNPSHTHKANHHIIKNQKKPKKTKKPNQTKTHKKRIITHCNHLFTSSPPLHYKPNQINKNDSIPPLYKSYKFDSRGQNCLGLWFIGDRTFDVFFNAPFVLLENYCHGRMMHSTQCFASSR